MVKPKSRMTAQFLTNELTNLVQEAKRKNLDLRHVRALSLGRPPGADSLGWWVLGRGEVVVGSQVTRPSDRSRCRYVSIY